MEASLEALSRPRAVLSVVDKRGHRVQLALDVDEEAAVEIVWPDKTRTYDLDVAAPTATCACERRADSGQAMEVRGTRGAWPVATWASRTARQLAQRPPVFITYRVWYHIQPHDARRLGLRSGHSTRLTCQAGTAGRAHPRCSLRAFGLGHVTDVLVSHVTHGACPVQSDSILV